MLIPDIRIPVYRPSLAGNEKKYVLDCLDSSWISSKGQYIERFEKQFADNIQTPHATAVSNGTVALHAALLSLDIGPGDEVIVPTFTYIASVNAIAYCGATPVFVDSLPSSWQMDPRSVERVWSQKTKAVMAVHLYGHPCEMDPLVALCRSRNAYLVEDCAEGFGTRYRSRHVGTFGDIATFSFFGNKTITCGEGGMITTSDANLDNKVRRLRGQGLADHREYWHDRIGYNYRMTNVAAAIGLAQLERASELIAKKKQLASWYAEALQGLPLELHSPIGDVDHSYWMVSVLLRDESTRTRCRELMRQKGIETRPTFSPVHLMPPYQHLAKPNAFPVAFDLASRGINLPSWPDLTADQVKFIVEVLRSGLTQ